MVLEGYVTPDGVWADYEAHDYEAAADDAANIATAAFLPRIQDCLAKVCECEGGVPQP